MPTNQRELGAPENVLNQVAAAEPRQPPVAFRWRYGAECDDTRWHFSEIPIGSYLDRTIEPLYLAPPRDVLMAFGEAVLVKAGVFMYESDIAALADRYASQVQTERNTVTLEEMVAKLKAGENGDAISEAMTQATADMALGRAIREGRASQSEPVNQQMLAALERLLECYKMADHSDGYCCCGSPIATHDDPMNCGHCATDAGEYNAGLIIKDMEAAIASVKGGAAC